MKITKDEARILAYLMEDGKYELNDMNHLQEEKNGIKPIDVFKKLQDRLSAFGKDKRRNGRKSHDDFWDCLKRYINIIQKSNDNRIK